MTNAVPARLNWRLPEILLAMLFVLAPLYYHPNLGGEGLRIPHNAMIWLVALLFVGVSLRQVMQRQLIRLPSGFWLFAAFPLLVTLSGFIAGVEQPLKWAFRMLTIWIGLLFFISVLQLTLTSQRQRQLLTVIVLAGLIHVLIGILQLLFHADLPFLRSPTGAPTGLFQQINNHSTYLVTLIGIALYLLTPSQSDKPSPLITVLFIVFMAGAAFVIGASGSRIGALTLLTMLGLILAARFNLLRLNKGPVLLALAVIMIGFVSGVISSQSRVIDKVTALDSGFSGEARLSIYKLSSDLLLEKPLTGHGIGSFPHQFQNAKPAFYQQNPDAYFGKKLISHPHNELFFWGVEGGLLALVGLLLTALAVAMVLWRSGYQRGLTGLALVAPIAMHLLVELPFYISALHWFLWLFLLAWVFRPNLKDKPFNLSKAMTITIRFGGLTAMVIGVLFLLHTFYANYQLVNYQDISRQTDEIYLQHAKINPYLGQVAQEVDMSILFHSALNARNAQFMEIYIPWAEKRIADEPKPYLVTNLATAYSVLQQVTEACRVRQYGQSLYPDDATLGELPEYCH
ncbi:Lipid A core-O-antigen ligase [Methylophaga frappieri]|uniref:Lipid A core-O-antigen ligase n=1 Tax=Methylophaga frappieri (strain ATCC BAA-2434 / DSM 25690 / JAM7) TaxID=754477 RepID=I1YEK2_METFJ|nr:Wzy polymerase domain-containing protein [Methylophaga frappieri]AFJ01345.1 Lipid A core-O-antigen ligase [Methylophaga frappieri]